jgi:hypothetical protein
LPADASLVLGGESFSELPRQIASDIAAVGFTLLAEPQLSVR